MLVVSANLDPAGTVDRLLVDDALRQVLDFLLQPRRSARSAGRLIRKLLKRQGFAPKRIITDRLKSYAVALRTMQLSAIHDQERRANNGADDPYEPIRRRERKLQRLTSPGSAQRFLSIHAAFYNVFYVQRYLLPRRLFKRFRAETFSARTQSWLLASSRSR